MKVYNDECIKNLKFVFPNDVSLRTGFESQSIYSTVDRYLSNVF